MGSCTRFGAVTGVTEREGLERKKESVVVLSGGELDGGRRATMWVSPQAILLS